MKKTKLVFIQIVAVSALTLMSGCALAPLKGGHATTSQLAGHIDQNLAQGENPAQVSRQDQETIRTKSYTVPAGSRLVSSNAEAVVVSAPMPVVEH